MKWKNVSGDLKIVTRQMADAYGWTALHVAAANGHLLIVAEAFHHCAGVTALHLAS